MSNRSQFGSFDMQNYSSYQSGQSSTAPPGAPRELSGEFSRLSQIIASNVQKITQNVAQMQRMINQIGTQMDTPELRDKLHQIQHYTNQLAKETNQSLKDFTRLPQSSNTSEQRQQKMHRERLTDDFSSALNNFQAAQRQEKEREKESMQRAAVHRTSHSTFDPFSDDQRSDERLVGFDNEVAQLQLEDGEDVALLHEREQAIHKLEMYAVWLPCKVTRLRSNVM